MKALPARAQPSTAELRLRVQRRAGEFELEALVEALRLLGYDDEHIYFQSQDSLASQPGIIDSITFVDTPDALPWADDRAASRLADLAEAGDLPGLGVRPTWAEVTPLVIITLNLGLLGPQSPLPGYFFNYMDDPLVRGQAMRSFLRFFDDRLLRAYLRAHHPELGGELLGDYDRHRRDLLHSQGLGSVSAVHALFAAVFPELDVSVERGPLSLSADCDRVVLGESALGRGAAFGGQRKISTAGFTVRLRALDPMTLTNVPWGIEAGRRCEAVLRPLLRRERIEACVVVETVGAPEILTLSPSTHLGFGVLGRPQAAGERLNLTLVGSR